MMSPFPVFDRQIVGEPWRANEGVQTQLDIVVVSLGYEKGQK
jgi:hypothetical protein